MESIVSRIWHAFNDETSFLPFYVPLVIWLAAYAYSLSRGFALHKWHAVLNLHNFGAISVRFIEIVAITVLVYDAPSLFYNTSPDHFFSPYRSLL
jgi:hypothetical protein